MSDEKALDDAYWALVDVANYERWVGDAEHAVKGANAGVELAKNQVAAAKDNVKAAEQDLAQVKAKQKAAADKVAALSDELRAEAEAKFAGRATNRTVYVEAETAEGYGS